jgi:SRSO17 transposase
MPAHRSEYEHVVPESSIEPLVSRLHEFMTPFYPLFGRRSESHTHAQMYVEGRVGRLERRTLEPIANENDVPRRPLQMFVGAGRWDDEPVIELLRNNILDELAMPGGVLIMDASGVQKWGKQSVGVQRQYCGRLGKVENCQLGEYLGYASAKGHTLVDYRLYLPRVWASDRARRAAAHVPKDIKFQKGWELGYAMVKLHAPHIRHDWILGDDAYGRVTELRMKLDTDGERYLLDVPSDTRVQVKPNGRFLPVAEVADAIPKNQWTTVRLRDGEKGPIDVRAVKLRVTTKTGKDKNQALRRETLLLVRRPSVDKQWFYLSNAKGFSVRKMAKAACRRHCIEESFELAKGEAGLAEYEVRSWVGWHHHMALSLLALFFVVRERNRLKKNAGNHGATGSLGHVAVARTEPGHARSDRRDRTTNDATARSERGSALQSLGRSRPARPITQSSQDPLEHGVRV